MGPSNRVAWPQSAQVLPFKSKCVKHYTTFRNKDYPSGKCFQRATRMLDSVTYLYFLHECWEVSMHTFRKLPPEKQMKNKRLFAVNTQKELPSNSVSNNSVRICNVPFSGHQVGHKITCNETFPDRLVAGGGGDPPPHPKYTPFLSS